MSYRAIYIQSCLPGLGSRVAVTPLSHIFKLARSWPPSASPNSLDHVLQVYLHTCSITASKCSSNLNQSQSQSASRSSLNLGLPVYLQILSIPAFYCVSNLTQSWPRNVSLSSLDRHFQLLIEILSGMACGQSRYAVCRWVAILIH